MWVVLKWAINHKIDIERSLQGDPMDRNQARSCDPACGSPEDWNWTNHTQADKTEVPPTDLNYVNNQGWKGKRDGALKEERILHSEPYAVRNLSADERDGKRGEQRSWKGHLQYRERGITITSRGTRHVFAKNSVCDACCCCSPYIEPPHELLTLHLTGHSQGTSRGTSQGGIASGTQWLDVL